MIDNLCIIVISHHRAHGYNTAKVASKTSKYPVYTLIDDQDQQMDEYLNSGEFPNVEVFCKAEYYAEADSMDNFGEYSTALYSRLAAHRMARAKGYEYAAILDDDITSIDVRWPENGKLKSLKIHGEMFDDMLEAMCNFLADTPCNAFAGGHQGLSTCSKTSYTKNNLYPEMIGTYVVKVWSDIEYRGTQGEDRHFLISSWDSGLPVFATNRINLHAPERGSNAGGIDYSNFYVANWYSLMAWPAGHKITQKGNCMGNRNATFPKVISSRWRK